MTTETTEEGRKNAGLAYEVLDYISKYPEQHDQAAYLSALGAGDHAAPGPDCGTVACFASWTAILAGDVLEHEDGGLIRIQGFDSDIHDRAQELLGLSVYESLLLFLGTQDAKKLPEVVARLFGPRPDGGVAR